MLRRLVTVVGVLCLLGLATPGGVEAQGTARLASDGLDLRLFRPAMDANGHFTVNGSDVLGHTQFSFGLVLDGGIEMLPFRGFISEDDVIADNARRRGHIVDSQFTGTLLFNLGLWNRLEVGMQLPITFLRGPAMAVPGFYNEAGVGLQSQGVGDLSLNLKLRLIRTDNSPIGLAVLLRTTFPTGDARELTGDAGVTLWPSAVLELRPHDRIRFSIEAGYRVVLGQGPEAFPFNGRTCAGGGVLMMGSNVCTGGTGNATNATLRDSGDPLTYDDLLTFGLGASFRLARSFDLVGEVYGSQIAAEFGERGALSMEALGGLKIFVQEHSYLVAAFGGGLPTDGFQAARWRMMLGFVFEPSVADADGDGIRDDLDQCDDIPEDFDDFEDSDGCPELDNDRDGIPDVDDQCPNVPEDRDGVEDDDGCPEGGEGDRDHDGIPDDQDRCPDDPEDHDGFQDEDGCPDPDNDNDGIPDRDDMCPNNAEDRDGFEDDDGCPEPDNDHDRILDPDDACPNEPETYNGFRDQDGCPDRGSVVIEDNQLIILDKIYFATNSAEILSRSFPILDAVAATLVGNPQIRLMEVQGHADERGDDQHNLRLTLDRAAAVVDALIQRGVERARVRSAGYGELCPVNPAHSRAAWEQNRRVEFKILETDAGPTGVEIACPAGQHLIPR